MALPVLNAPTHELTLTSTGETIQFRPFLVKEEKLLLMALESGNDSEMMKAMKQIISSCVINEIDVEKLPLFDIQYLFLNIRSQSVGETVTLRFKHPEEKNSKGDDCKHIQEIEINISSLKPEPLEGHSKKIEFADDIGVIMQYPGLEMYERIIKFESEDANTTDAIFKIMIDNIEMIYQGEEVFYKDDHSEEELYTFLESLNTQQFNKLRDFFQTMPYLRHEFEYTCEKCGCKEKVFLSGIEDFFA